MFQYYSIQKRNSNLAIQKNEKNEFRKRSKIKSTTIDP